MNSWNRKLTIRIISGICMILLAILFAFVFEGFAGEGTPMWQRDIYVILVLGTGLSGILGMILGIWGFVFGYALALFMFLPRMLPSPWRGYIPAAFWAAITIYLLVEDKPKKRSFNDEEDEAASIMVVQQTTNGRYFQIIRYGDELRAYRVGGELRDVDIDLLQSEEDKFRILGDKDFFIPIAAIQRVRCKKLSNNSAGYDCAAVVKTEKKSYRFAPTYLTTNKAFTSFWRKINPERIAYEIASEMVSEKQDPKRIRIFGRILKICYAYLAIVNIGWLYLNVPYKLFAVLAMLAMPIVFVIYCCFQNEASILEEPKDISKESLLLPMVFSNIVLFFRLLLDFNFVDEERMVVITLIVVIILMIISLICTKEWLKQKTAILYIAVVLFFYAPGTVAQINYVFDTSEPIVEHAVVTDMDISTMSRGPDSYYLTVELEDGREQKLQVPMDQYYETEIGDAVTVMTYEGFLGISYADVV